MRGVNKVILVGTLGRDPETKSFANGGSITNFSIATSEQWTDKATGERKELTEWHRISTNNRLAEIAMQYLKKGSKVYIEGSLRTRKWTDQNGQERYATEIRADQMQMLDAPRSQNNQSADSGAYGGGNSGGGYGGYSDQAYSAPESRNTAPQPARTAAPAKPAPQYNQAPVAAPDFDDDLPF